MVFQCIHNCSLSSLLVKLIGKLQDGNIFVKKGHDEEPFQFKTDEGNNSFDNLIWFFQDTSYLSLSIRSREIGAVSFILKSFLKLFLI